MHLKKDLLNEKNMRKKDNENNNQDYYKISNLLFSIYRICKNNGSHFYPLKFTKKKITATKFNTKLSLRNKGKSVRRNNLKFITK